MEIKEIKRWFELAVPEPTDKSRAVQIGCHYEEVAEMAAVFFDETISHDLDALGGIYKACADADWSSLDEVMKAELLDSICDQIVTAIGIAHMFGFDIEGALKEVNRSNFSKFVDGKPVFNEQGKISKPFSYSPPNLLPFMGDQK